MLKLVLTGASLVAGWNHLGSFNENCGAEISLLRGTEFETSATAGKLPYQFKTAFAEVIKARVATEGCTLTPQQQALFYGMEPINFLRLFDAYDTDLNNTAFPCTGTPNIKWSWQQAKWDIEGILLPTSCRSATFATTKQCNAKFRIVDNLFIEINYADKCTDPSKAGYGLPQMTLSCSGSMCATLGMPCTSTTNCGAGSSCHTFTDSALNGTLQFFLDTGLFNDLTDMAGCMSGGFNFQEQFMSDALNNIANMLGLTSSLSTDRYSSVSLCGIGEIDRRFNPSDAPTPAPMFRCDDNSAISYGQVCDGTNNCANGEDEVNCTSCNAYGFSYQYGECCPICLTYPNNYYNCYNSRCSQSYPVHTSIQICNKTTWGIDCPDLTASAPVTNLPAAQAMASVSSSNPNEHILGFADCNGNIQLGNTNDMIVANGKLPFQKIAARVESIMKTREACRTGTAVSDWKRYFFPWAVNFWGGVLYGTQATAGIFGNVNPGVKVDDSMKYYNYAKQYNATPPPYSNVANAPPSCDATTTGTGVCELNWVIGEWFNGNFPAGWNSATTIHTKAASTCASSGLPQVYVTCEGPCTSSAKSGCCLIKEPFLPSTNFACPAGYVLDNLESGVTDFLFNMTSTLSKDTTIINFASLVATRTSAFGTTAGTAPFISVGMGTNTQFCRINGSDFGNNVEGWANKTATDKCPYPPVPGGNGTDACPQILSGGGIQGCGTSCVTMPSASACPTSGCPSTPTTPTPGGGGGINGVAAAGLSAAAAFVVVLTL